MTLTELTTLANNLTDESVTTAITMTYANNAISRINTSLKSTLPLITSAATDYSPYLSTDWMTIVVAPYVCWAIKMNDGSLNEAREFLYQFELGLKNLKTNKRTAIDSAYQGTGFTSVYKLKTPAELRAYVAAGYMTADEYYRITGLPYSASNIDGGF